MRHGLNINPYDCCVANKIINVKQCIIAFYVDANKIIHKDPNVNFLKEHFEYLAVYREKELTFLGKNFRIREDKKIWTEMKYQLMEAIDMFGKEVPNAVTSPAE